MKITSNLFYYLCCLLIIIPIETFSRDSTYNFSHVNTEGLLSGMVHSMFVDSRGFMWFGTQNGLSRWDGLTFKNYTTGNNRDSTVLFLLPQLSLILQKIRDSNIWIANLFYRYYKNMFQKKDRFYLFSPGTTGEGPFWSSN